MPIDSEKIQQWIYQETAALFDGIDSPPSREVVYAYQYVAHSTFLNRMREGNTHAYNIMMGGALVETLKERLGGIGISIAREIELPPVQFDKWKSEFLDRIDTVGGFDGAQVRAGADALVKIAWPQVAHAHAQSIQQSQIRTEPSIARIAMLNAAHKADRRDTGSQAASSPHVAIPNANAQTRRI